MAAGMDLSEWEADPRLFLFTSLTSGSSHIVTATSRLETILKANKIAFLAIDIATDEKARRLWSRRAGKKKLPGLVKEGYVLGDLEEVEEWNEFGELKDNIGPAPPPAQAAAAPPPVSTPTAPAVSPPVSRAPPPLVDDAEIRPLSGAASGGGSEKEPVEASTSTQDTAAPAASTDAAPGEPLSAVASTPSIPALPEAALTHRGSSLSAASAEEIKEAEQKMMIPEEDEEESASAAVEGVQTGTGVETQKQESANADDAGVSVED